MAIGFFGLLLGLIFNWQLAIIIFLPFLMYFVVCGLSISAEKWFTPKSAFILERASTVRLDFYLQPFYMWNIKTVLLPCLSFLQLAAEVIQNMRTIKQLSVEKEVLQRYSQYVHQSFM